MKTTNEMIQIANTGVNLIIDAGVKTTNEIIQIINVAKLNKSNIIVKNASRKTTNELIQISTVYPQNTTLDFTEI